jgi:hypothetical protein
MPIIFNFDDGSSFDNLFTRRSEVKHNLKFYCISLHNEFISAKLELKKLENEKLMPVCVLEPKEFDSPIR